MSEPARPGFIDRYITQPQRGDINRFIWAPNGDALACPTTSGDIVLCTERQSYLLTCDESQDGTAEAADSEAPTPALSATWSPDNRYLLSSSLHGTVSLWDVAAKSRARQIPIHSDWVASVAWNPHDGRVASGSKDHTIRIWDLEGQEGFRLDRHEAAITCVAWSPTGRMLASSSLDGSVLLWGNHGDNAPQRINGQGGYILFVCWDNNGDLLATASSDSSVRIWDPKNGSLVRVLEGHTAPVSALSFSFDGRLLASSAMDASVRIWRCDTWQEVATLPHGCGKNMFTSVSFHPFEPILALPGTSARSIRVLEYDHDHLTRWSSGSTGVRYRNAKAVLVGDTGVGKSGLGLVLSGHAFRPTESTAGRRVWAFAHDETRHSDGVVEVRESFLWDLPGQSGHRLVNQLHLQEVAVAIVVFDAHGEKDPFAGVRHWIRALRQAQARQPGWVHPSRIILVAGRCDASGTPASSAMVEQLRKELGFHDYFETSALEGWDIMDLRRAISAAIDWSSLPTTNSSTAFHSVRQYLSRTRGEGRLLTGQRDLYDQYCRSSNALEDPPVSEEEFSVSLRLLATRGVLYKFGFSNLVLMVPEYLDYYASAVVQAARDEPLGMGSILERDIIEARFRLADTHRFPNRTEERLLLIATVETLLQNEVALRESTEDGDIIVLPGQFRHDRPDTLPGEQRTASIRFEGPILNIYAALVVRLTHSHFFRKKELWRKGALFDSETGGDYGFHLKEHEDGSGELELFFGAGTPAAMRVGFESYVMKHLARSAIDGSIVCTRVYRCQSCGLELAAFQVQFLRAKGFAAAPCMQCKADVSLTDAAPGADDTVDVIPEMDRAANRERRYATRLSRVRGRKALRQYDIFLSYNRDDRKEVQPVAQFLQKMGVATWLDTEDMPAGISWQQALEEIIVSLKSAVIFCGRHGIGSRQRMEIEALVDHYADRDLRLFPVILPNATEPQFPLFVRNRNWIDLREHGQLKRLLSEIRAALSASCGIGYHSDE